MKYRERSIFCKRLLAVAMMASMIGTVGWMIVNPDHYFAIRSLFWNDGNTISPIISSTSVQDNLNANVFTGKSSVTEHSIHASVAQELFPTLQEAIAKFQTTVRSCLGSYCMDEKFTDAENNNEKIERIGILLPDKRISTWEALISQMQSFDDVKSSSKRKIFPSTHVAAYGYGRNHGWSRIVRIVDDLPLQAYQLINHNHIDHEVNKLYEIQVRICTAHRPKLLMYFGFYYSALLLIGSPINEMALSTQSRRCPHIYVNRLGPWIMLPFEVTLLFSLYCAVYTKDLLTHPYVEFDKILSFIGIKATREQVSSLMHRHMDSLKKFWDTHYHDLPEEFANIATKSIENEMEISDDLSKWPCNSFLDLEQAYGILPYSRYFEVSADCSNSFVKCSVQFDKKEQKQE